MIPLLRLLFDHLAWADSTLLSNVRDHAAARDDEEIRRLLQHIVAVQRFFLFLLLDRPLDSGRETQPPASFAELEPLYREAHQAAIECLDGLTGSDLAKEVEMPHRREFRRSVRDILIQVVMHSEHHRAQCAARLRALGGTPAVTDYIFWAGQHGSRTTA